MATIKIIDPVSRIEGHLKVEIEIDKGVVTNAKLYGTFFPVQRQDATCSIKCSWRCDIKDYR